MNAWGVKDCISSTNSSTLIQFIMEMDGNNTNQPYWPAFVIIHI